MGPLKALIATVTIFLMVGCTTPSGTFCAISSPIRLSAPAVAALSDAEVKTILAHNRKGAALCHWRP